MIRKCWRQACKNTFELTNATKQRKFCCAYCATRDRKEKDEKPTPVPQDVLDRVAEDRGRARRQRDAVIQAEFEVRERIRKAAQELQAEDEARFGAAIARDIAPRLYQGTVTCICGRKQAELYTCDRCGEICCSVCRSIRHAHCKPA